MARETNGKGERVVRKWVKALKPAPENERLYHRLDEDDPGIIKLGESIQRNGCDELLISKDNYVIWGHRRRLALLRIGQEQVRCRVLDVIWADLTKEEKLLLLRDGNQQRDKSAAEEVNEELIDIDPDRASKNLLARRYASVCAAECNGLEFVEAPPAKPLHEISEDKQDHVEHIKKAIYVDLKDFLPASGRKVHYQLCNYKFIRGYLWPHKDKPGHGVRQTLWYQNDEKSWNATTELLVRLRYNGTVGWDDISDDTRPIVEFRPFKNVKEFWRQQIEEFGEGYWRDLLQSQPNAFVLCCEKNTVFHLAQRVTKEYQFLTMSGHGFSSVGPWHQLAEKFKESGRQRLFVVLLSDYDPEGERIPEVALQTLRDREGLGDRVKVVKAGVTRRQVEQYHLPRIGTAKESSSNWDWFIERNQGDDTCWELEALDPADLMRELEEVIKKVIDVGLYNKEVQTQDADLIELIDIQERGLERLKDLLDD
jgi:hypothetical protein